MSFFPSYNQSAKKNITDVYQTMADKKISIAVSEFAKWWEGRGYENGKLQLFWVDLLTNVYGIENLPGFIRYEEQVTSMIDSTS